MDYLELDQGSNARIKVVGCGGGGGVQSPRSVRVLNGQGNDYNIPAYLRKGTKKGGPEAALSQPIIKSQPVGEEEFIFDEEEFEIPSFIRMQAD